MLWKSHRKTFRDGVVSYNKSLYSSNMLVI
jgi:hypothetical protein